MMHTLTGNDAATLTPKDRQQASRPGGTVKLTALSQFRWWPNVFV